MAASISLYAPSDYARSQELAPVATLLSDDGELSYPALRCAALHNSVVNWAGQSRLGDELAEQTESLIQKFLMVVVSFRTEQNLGDPKKIAAITFRDLNNVTELYLERFERNYAVTGHAFGKDKLVQADLETCGIMAEVLQ